MSDGGFWPWRWSESQGLASRASDFQALVDKWSDDWKKDALVGKPWKSRGS